jgi:hypothetical protein
MRHSLVAGNLKFLSRWIRLFSSEFAGSLWSYIPPPQGTVLCPKDIGIMFCLDGGTYMQNHMCHIPKASNSPPVDETGTNWTSAKRCRHYSCFTSLCKTHWFTLKQNKMVNIRVHTRKRHSSHDINKVCTTKQDKSRNIHIVHTTKQDKSHDIHYTKQTLIIQTIYYSQRNKT